MVDHISVLQKMLLYQQRVLSMEQLEKNRKFQNYLALILKTDKIKTIFFFTIML